MINTISLSTDHKYIYLIDKANCSKFRIDKGKGALISTLRHQLTVACALDVPKKGVEKKITLNKKDRQWQFFFVPGTESLNIIGTTDIQGSVQDEAEEIVIIGTTDIQGSLDAEENFKSKSVSRKVITNSREIIGTTDIQGSRKEQRSLPREIEEPDTSNLRDLMSQKRKHDSTPVVSKQSAKQKKAPKPVIAYKVRLEARIIHIYTNKAGNIEVRTLSNNLRS